MAIKRIIDTDNDTNYYTEVRNILDVTVDDLTDAFLKSDIVLGASEREVCGIYVDNWIDILNGDSAIKEEALRSCVILMVCMNIIESPVSQNLLENEFKIAELVVKNKNISIDEFKKSLKKLFEKQLSIVGVSHTGGDWPEREIVGKSNSYNAYDYYVDSNLELQEY